MDSMNKKMDDARIVDYLYGEMSAKERETFEKEVEENPELKTHIQELGGLRNTLLQVEDEEVVPPAFVFNSATKRTVSFFSSEPFRWVSSIAAGLMVLIVSAYLLDFNLTRDSNGLQLGFGEIQSTSTDLNKENVQAWMKEVIEDMEDSTNAKLIDMEAKLTTKMDSQDQQNFAHMQRMMTKYSEGTDQLMSQYVSQVSDENRQMIESFFDVSNETQQKYMQSVLADFNEFYQNQRSYDLQVIETSIDLMKNNYDVKQLEQESLLANLYDIVQTQSK